MSFLFDLFFKMKISILLYDSDRYSNLSVSILVIDSSHGCVRLVSFLAQYRDTSQCFL